jgi:hypothetical protein
MQWVKGIGELFTGHGFMFAPEHLPSIYQEMCVSRGLRLITCPKKNLATPMRNQKTGKMETRVDTVDETIAEFAKSMVGHPNFKTICLVSGDNDYVPLFEELGDNNIRRALAPPTLGSLSQTKQLINLVDINPLTGEKMILVLSEI